jgi:hypothetical protein
MLRERFGIYADGACPAGSTMNSPIFPGRLPCVSPEGVGIYHVCPSGSTPYSITTEDRVTAAICVPTSTAVYPRTTVNPAVFPCNTGDYLGFSDTGMKCIPAAAAAPATTTGDGLEALTTRLTALRAQYTTLANQATAAPAQIQTILPQIQTVNQQIAAVLDQMLTQMQYAREGANSETYRSQLVEQLARIQLDYNGLKTNTDAMQTLQRIRSFQDTSWQSTLMLYIGLFVFVAGLFALVVMVRRYTNTSASAPSPSPAAMAPLT